MTSSAPSSYLIEIAGSVIAAAIAILQALRERKGLEPSEADVSSVFQRLAGVLGSIAIVLMWVGWRSSRHFGDLERTAIFGGIGAVVFALVYTYLIGVQSYDVVLQVPGTEQTETIRIIGGFWLKRTAREAKREHHVPSTQTLLAGNHYDPEGLWSRPNRTIAQMTFGLVYMCLTLAMTIAIAAVSIRLGLGAG